MRSLILIACFVIGLASARAGVHGPWDNDPIVVATSSKDLAVYLMLDEHHVVICDVASKKLWLITVANPRQHPDFTSGKGYERFARLITVQAVITEDPVTGKRQVSYAMIPQSGHAWIVPLKSFEPWTAQQG